jgi:hypothetical protein
MSLEEKFSTNGIKNGNIGIFVWKCRETKDMKTKKMERFWEKIAAKEINKVAT